MGNDGHAPSLTNPVVPYRPKETVEVSVGRASRVCAETLQGRLETRTIPPDDGHAPSQSGASEAEVSGRAARTQFAGDGTDRTDLIIGLDFGTLSARVVVRSPYVGYVGYVGYGRAVPVRWRVRRGLPPHFLPAALHESANGELALTSDWNELEESNLKTDLMDHTDDLTARARAAAYLGLVLREARAYVLDTQEQAYGSYRLRWAVHVGIPSAGYDDQRVKTAFLCVARAAWILSRRSESPTLEIATAELKRAGETGMIESDPDLTGVEGVPGDRCARGGVRAIAASARRVARHGRRWRVDHRCVRVWTSGS